MLDNIEEPPQILGSSELTDDDEGNAVSATAEQLERPSFGARLRMIVLLSLLCWAALLAGLALAFA